MPVDHTRITLSHGSGGKQMTDLIERVFLTSYGTPGSARDDSAVLAVAGANIAFTTDSFVVEPIFFPGGNIGRLAVAGTVNDLLTAAARPVAISASFIIEEGLEISTLEAIAVTMRETAEEAGVRIVTGDTKVVPRGSADKVFITTAGVGVVVKPGVSGAAAKPGDAVILTGSLGDHGTAVMLAREKLLEAEAIESDAAPLSDMVLALIDAGVDIHVMRDPTRGGAASTLNEIAAQSQAMISVEETAVLVRPPVAAVCEALGIEPFNVANEGKMIIVVAPEDAERALAIVRGSRYGEEARIIGEVKASPAGRVQLNTALGTTRILRAPTGELLPRIC